MDDLLLEAMREVDAMLPHTPPIAPPRFKRPPRWPRMGYWHDEREGMIYFVGFHPVPVEVWDLRGPDALVPV